MISAIHAGMSSRLIKEAMDIKEQEREKINVEKAKKEAVSLCEGIINAKIRKAINDGKTYTTVYFEKGFCSENYYLLRERHKAYANGASSWEIDSKAFDLQEMLRILNSAGYITSVSSRAFHRYGLGVINACALTIEY